nr:hypothetical protein 2 (insertion sequence IS1110) - Mycobacterium avium [Mycobacterium avium]
MKMSSRRLGDRG